MERVVINTPRILKNLDYWTAFGERLAELMNYSEGSTVLDIGTGTGACLIPAAQKVGSKGSVIGIDLWKNRITQALANAKAHNLSNVSAEVMDASSLSFKDNQFDFVISGFIGFTAIYDFQNEKYRKENDIMKHILRVLKPKGKAGFSTWLMQGDLDFLRTLIQEYISKYNGVSSDLAEGVPTSYSKESIAGFKIIMQDAGFKEIEVFSEDFILKYKTVDDWFDMMTRVGWILRRTFDENETKIQDFKEKMLPHGLEPYRKDDGYYFTKSVIYAFGEK